MEYIKDEKFELIDSPSPIIAIIDAQKSEEKYIKIVTSNNEESFRVVCNNIFEFNDLIKNCLKLYGESLLFIKVYIRNDMNPNSWNLQLIYNFSEEIIR